MLSAESATEAYWHKKKYLARDACKVLVNYCLV